MKQLAASLLAFLLLPQSAHAWCDNPETGRSKAFFVAIYVVSGCNPNGGFPDDTEVITFTPTKKNRDAGSEPQTVRFSDECQRTNKGFSCAQGGRTPLAGTTYVTTKDMKDTCDETGKVLVNRLTCIKGCENGRAPKHIEGSPWEC